VLIQRARRNSAVLQVVAAGPGLALGVNGLTTQHGLNRPSRLPRAQHVGEQPVPPTMATWFLGGKAPARQPTLRRGRGDAACPADLVKGRSRRFPATATDAAL